MKKQTQAIHTRFQRRDAYDALSMPVYHTAAYEFDNADSMSDAFCGRTDSPDYSRVMNPTVTFFENKVRSLTGAAEVIALNSGMAAISNTLFSVAAAGRNIVTSRHLFGNTYALITGTLPRFGVSPRLCDLTDIQAVESAVDRDLLHLFGNYYQSTDGGGGLAGAFPDCTQEGDPSHSRHHAHPFHGIQFA